MKNEPTTQKEKAQTTISGLIEKLQTLKRKLNENYCEQDGIYESCKKRIIHLNSLVKPSKEQQNCYNKTRLNRLIVDYLLREGHLKTAMKIISEYRIEVKIRTHIKNNL